eukprot:SAG22_NODE_615_length_8539_cov_7.450592_5_plen_314_part_01
MQVDEAGIPSPVWLFPPPPSAKHSYCCSEAPPGGSGGYRKTHVVMLPAGAGGEPPAGAAGGAAAAAAGGGSGGGADIGTSRAVGVPQELGAFRAKLCRQTESAVERFDHFCPWVGNAVGARNHRYFVMFVCGVVLLAAAVFASSAAVAFSGISSLQRLNECGHAVGGAGSGARPVGRDDRDDGTAAGCHGMAYRAMSSEQFNISHAVAVGLTIYTFAIIWGPISLACYHLELVANDTTTNERIRPPRTTAAAAAAARPSCLVNYRKFFCVPPRPSYFEAPRTTPPPRAAGREAIPLMPRDAGGAGGGGSGGGSG